MQNNSYKLVLFFAIIFTIGCKEKPVSTNTDTDENFNENKVELSDAQMAQTTIQIGAITKRKIGHEITVNGMIDVPPQGNVSITSPYGGFLKKTSMLQGSRLKKGQLIAQVENPEFIEFQKDYLEALAKEDYLKMEFERQETLNKEGIASNKVFERAKSNYLVNNAQLQAMASKLELIGIALSEVQKGNISATVNIYSPINGVVREVFINTGKYFGKEDVLMDLTDASDLHVELKVYEDDINLIKNEQRIRFRLASTPEKWMEAEVFLVGNNVRDDRTITIHGHLKEINEALLPGMFVNANIEVGALEQYAIPEEGVVRFEGKNYVFISLGKRKEDEQTMNDFEMVEVVKGNEDDGYIAIILKENSQEIKELSFVLNDAFTILAKAKNSEEGGHGHGH